MLEKIKEIRAAMEKELRDAVSSEQLRELKVKYLGKKGSISEISKSMGKLQPEERPKAGQMVNELRQALEQNLARRQQELADKMLQTQLAKEKVDITLPGRPVKLGSKHPLTQVMDDFKEIFLGMGYAIAEGPQVELDYYNFERMNLPADHPARDMQDSFYIDAKRLLRTHTSPVQARAMDRL